MDKNKIIEEVMLDTDWRVLWEAHKSYLQSKHNIILAKPINELEQFKALGRNLLEDLLENSHATEVGSMNLVAFKNTNEELFVGYGLMYRINGGNSWTERK